MISTAADLLPRVKRIISHHSLFCPGDVVVVALSGGADSTALLDLLSRFSDYNPALVAVHLNHGLRGAESDADQEFCRVLSSRYAIPFETRFIDIKKIAAARRQNLEDAGRQARIAFFDEVRSKYGAAAVALAHHADDQAETMLMRLLRGSGMTGLSGMAYRNTRGYVRPLLDVTRSEIERYLLERGLEWREDSSNSDTVYLRNRIRHELLPLLEGYNPAIRSRLSQSASILGGDESLLVELTEQAFASTCKVGEGTVYGSVLQLRALHPALRRRVLRYAFRKSAGTLDGVSHRHVDALCDQIDSSRPNSRLAFPHGITVSREYDNLTWAKVDNTAHEAGYELKIMEPGCYQLPGGGSITVEVVKDADFSAGSETGYFDLGRTPFPWLIRNFHPGDRMTPFGMSGRKKIKDIFIDRKIPHSERRRIPILCSGVDIVWIPGVCFSELNRICKDTDIIIKANFTRH